MTNKSQKDSLIKRALATPSIADFQITREDIENNLISVFKIFKNQDLCKSNTNQNLCGSNGYHFKLIKDEFGKILLVTYPCPKNLLNKPFLIKNNYIYSSVNLSTQQQLIVKKDITSTDKEINIDRVTFLNFMIKIKKEKLSPKGFYVYGDVNVGKSHLIIAFCNEMAIQNKKIAYLIMNNFCLDIMQNVQQQKDSSELLESLKMADILVLDELGTEKYNAFVHNQILYSILNYRLHTNKITIFCSKYSNKELKAVYKIASHDRNIDGFIERINKICETNVFYLKTKIL